jgi:hypothetical protein
MKVRKFGALFFTITSDKKIKPTKWSETPNHYSKLGVPHFIFRDIALDRA